MVMRSAGRQRSEDTFVAFLSDALTFRRLHTPRIIHFVYWAGLGVISLGAFGVIGAAVGLAAKEPGLVSILLALPVLVAGLLVVGAFGLLWRSFCEFYVIIATIGEDLQTVRRMAQTEVSPPTGAPPPTNTMM